MKNWKNLFSKRNLDKTLSQGQGAQLFWLLGALAVVVAVLLLVGFLFLGKGFRFMELMSLLLDPGNVDGGQDAGFGYNLFRLVATLLGIILMSALLISVVGNMFENIGESFREGISRYRHSGHVIVIGSGHQLHGILNAVSDPSNVLHGKDIVVLSQRDVEDLRNEVFDRFDPKADKDFLDTVTFYYGSRTSVTGLRSLSPGKAERIYIIGEDGEENRDHLNVKCFEALKEACRDAVRPVRCFLVVDDRMSVDVFRFEKTAGPTCLQLEVVDEFEYMAAGVLVADHDGRDVVHYPKIDYRGAKQNGEGKWEQVTGILPDTEKSVHFVVAGMTDTAKAMAVTAANICHFPNFKDGRYRTRITFIAKDIEGPMNLFVSRYEHLFMLSHYRFVRFTESGQCKEEVHSPDPAYGDFLDVEWEFIEGEMTDGNVRRLLVEWARDGHRSLSLCLCLPTQDENADTALSLPGEIYRKDRCIPIFVHQSGEGDLIIKARKTGQYGLMYAFGMSSEIQDDPLYENTRGKKVNFVYDRNFNGPENRSRDKDAAWAALPEAHKLSSVYSANSVFCKMRSFGVDPNAPDLSILGPQEIKGLEETEHRRWTLSCLFLGFRPMTREERTSLRERLADQEKAVRNQAKDEKKALKADFVHWDIAPYDELPEEEADKDLVIILNIPYIVGKADSPVMLEK